MYLLLYLAVAVTPPALLVHYFYRRDKKHANPTGMIHRTFLIGLLITIPAFALEFLLVRMQSFLAMSNLSHHLFRAFLIIAPSEELFKLIVVIFVVYNHKRFNKLMDGIIYTIIASLGFACTENIVYALSGGIGVAIFRFFTALPMHIITAGIMGYYISKAKLSFSKTEETRLIFTGLLYAVLIHGAYDFVLLASAEMRLVASIGILVILVSTFLILQNIIKLATASDLAYQEVPILK